jgi:hypothetical protein
MNVRVVRKGNYLYVKDDEGCTLAGFSKITGKYWGITKYFDLLEKRMWKERMA